MGMEQQPRKTRGGRDGMKKLQFYKTSSDWAVLPMFIVKNSDMWVIVLIGWLRFVVRFERKKAGKQ
jgi:hypothetical protein